VCFGLSVLFCVVAAYIDGTQLKVPNAITFPMIIAGWLYSSFSYGMAGEGWYWGLALELWLGRRWAWPACIRSTPSGAWGEAT
jgi:hypothetical protein